MKEQGKNAKILGIGRGIDNTIKNVEQDEENFFVEFNPIIYKIPKNSVDKDLTNFVGKRIKIGNFGEYNKGGHFRLIVFN